MINKHFESVEDALNYANHQPDPVAALRGMVNQAMVDDEYSFARELLEQGEEQHEYQVEIIRTEPRVAYRTARGVGPDHLCRESLVARFADTVAPDIDFNGEKSSEPIYEVVLTERI
jgi:hypothetical protein